MNFKLKDQMNFYDEFIDWYLKIIDDFRFNLEEDRVARNYLSKILDSKNYTYDIEQVLQSFRSHITRKENLLIYGCGPSLERSVEQLLNLKGVEIFHKFINLAADGASVFLKENSIPVAAIFTDLDGITQDEFNYSQFNIVHAHGDNVDKIRSFEKVLIEFKNIIGTTQSEPFGNIINPGGFTDGDRILYFLRTLINPSQKIFFIGMDFNEVIGKYSKPHFRSNLKSNKTKRKKLQYAIKLLEWIHPKLRNEIFFVNCKKLINSFNYISLVEFMKILEL